jgi:hypothetical protein
MTAAGTSGHGAELSAYFPLAELGAVVVKSLSQDSPTPGSQRGSTPTGHNSLRLGRELC